MQLCVFIHTRRRGPLPFLHLFFSTLSCCVNCKVCLLIFLCSIIISAIAISWVTFKILFDTSILDIPWERAMEQFRLACSGNNIKCSSSGSGDVIGLFLTSILLSYSRHNINKRYGRNQFPTPIHHAFYHTTIITTYFKFKLDFQLDFVVVSKYFYYY